MLRYNPSLIAASAIYLNNKIAKREPAWPINLMDNSGYRENDLKNCAKDICVLLQGVEKCSLQAVRKKFSLPKFGEVAKLQLFWTMH